MIRFGCQGVKYIQITSQGCLSGHSLTPARLTYCIYPRLEVSATIYARKGFTRCLLPHVTTFSFRISPGVILLVKPKSSTCIPVTRDAGKVNLKTYLLEKIIFFFCILTVVTFHKMQISKVYTSGDFSPV